MKKKFYVTVQLTNGGIESVEIELDEDIKATYDIFKEYIDEYDDKNMDYPQIGLWSKGHIIAWSQIETE